MKIAYVSILEEITNNHRESLRIILKEQMDRENYSSLSIRYFAYYILDRIYLNYFTNRDLIEIKRLLSLLGQTASLTNEKQSFFGYPRPATLGILLSDDVDLFQDFVDWDVDFHTSGNVYGWLAMGFVPILWHLFRDDKDAVVAEFDYWDIRGKELEHFDGSDHYTNYSWELSCVFAEQDPIKIKEEINKIICLKRQQQLGKDTLRPYENYFSLIGTFYAKAAWKLGHEIEFDNPYIDMDLVRISPLDSYPKLEDFIAEFHKEHSLN